MNEQLNELINNERLVEIINKALDMVEEQMLNPDIYNKNTHETMSELSSIAGFLKPKAIEYKIFGNKQAAEYIEAVIIGLNYMIADLKYKIKANLG